MSNVVAESVCHVSIQTERFDMGVEQARLAALEEAGGVVVFTGQVRAQGERGPLAALHLEHYPGMTERALRALGTDAIKRWSLLGVTVIHRVGRLAVGEPIVLVGVASRHRADAYAANEFIMDVLKTTAPFWKQEILVNGESHWLEQKVSDQRRRDRWRDDG